MRRWLPLLMCDCRSFAVQHAHGDTRTVYGSSANFQRHTIYQQIWFFFSSANFRAADVVWISSYNFDAHIRRCSCKSWTNKRISSSVQRKICDCSFCNGAHTDGRVALSVTLNGIDAIFGGRKYLLTAAQNESRFAQKCIAHKSVWINRALDDSGAAEQQNRPNKMCATW